jgi:hypothetical protein
MVFAFFLHLFIKRLLSTLFIYQLFICDGLLGFYVLFLNCIKTDQSALFEVAHIKVWIQSPYFCCGILRWISGLWPKMHNFCPIMRCFKFLSPHHLMMRFWLNGGVDFYFIHIQVLFAGWLFFNFLFWLLFPYHYAGRVLLLDCVHQIPFIALLD